MTLLVLMALLGISNVNIAVKNTFVDVSFPQPSQLRRSVTAPADTSTPIVTPIPAVCIAEESLLSNHLDERSECPVDCSQVSELPIARANVRERSPETRYFDESPLSATVSEVAVQPGALPLCQSQQLGLAFIAFVPACQLQPVPMTGDVRCTAPVADAFAAAPCLGAFDDFSQQWGMPDLGFLGTAAAHMGKDYTPSLVDKVEKEGPKAVFVDLSKLRLAKPRADARC